MNKKAIILLVIALIVIAIVLAAHVVLSQPKKMDTSNQSQNSPTSFDIQGMKVDIIKQGTGDGAKVGDEIAVNYTGTLTNGKTFDSSVDPTFGHVTPFTYTLGQNQVIQGWELGLLGMKDGEERKLTIPPELGYGAGGAGNAIPPNSTLIFDITMLSINGK